MIAAIPRVTGSVSAACACASASAAAVPAHELRRGAELQRQRRAQRRCGRLGLRALQVRERARRARRARSRSPPASRSRSTTQASAARRREHQLGGDPLRAGAEVGLQPRGAGVLEAAAGGGQLEVDGVAHQRVHEPSLVGAQDLGPHERLDRLRGLGLPRARQRGDGGEARLLAEHRDRAGDGGRGRRQPGEPQQDRARRPRAARSPEIEAASGGRCSPASARQQLAQQQRVAGRDVLAGGGEGAVGVAEQRGHEPERAVGGQRLGPDGDGRRVLADLAQQQLVGVRLAGADRGRDQHGQRRDAAREVGDEAQRGGVAPLQVVDAEHERAARGQRGGVGVQRARGPRTGRRPAPPSPNTARAPAAGGSARPRRAGARRRSRTRARARRRARRGSPRPPPARARAGRPAAASCRSRPGLRRPARRRWPALSRASAAAIAASSPSRSSRSAAACGGGAGAGASSRS